MPTVAELRNEIRLAVGRFERVESTPFTKETLAAVCEAVDADVETDPIPGRAEMRHAALRAVEFGCESDPAEYDRPFRKTELSAIADALRDE